MPTAEQIFDFLGDETRQRALTLIGGFFVTLVTAGWAYYLHRKNKSPSATETITLTMDDYRNWLLRESARANSTVQTEEERDRQATQMQIKALDERLESPQVPHAEALANLEDLAELFGKDPTSDPFADARHALQKGKIEEAEAALTKHQSSLEPYLRQASDLYLGLAVIAEQKADWRAAASNYSRSMALFETEENMLKASLFLWRTGSPQEAYIVSEKLLDIYRSKRGPRHPDVAGLMNNMAAQLYDLGKLSEDEKLIKKSISIRQELGLIDDSEYARALANLGNMLLVKGGDMEEVERLQRQSLAILQNSNVTRDSEGIAAVTNALAEALRIQGKLEEASDLLEANYQEALQRVGATHPDAARALNFLAKFQQSAGRYEDACRNYADALRIQSSALGSFHPNAIAIGCNLLGLLRERSELDDDRTLTTLERDYGEILDEARKQMN